MANRRTGKMINCIACGSEFYVQKWSLDQRKNCSLKCYRSTKLNKLCLNCNKIMNLTPHFFKKRKFCSQKCGSIYFQAKQLKTGKFISCKNCNKNFYASLWELSANKKYCSRECADEGHKIPLTKIKCKECNRFFFKKVYTTSIKIPKFCSIKCSCRHNNNSGRIIHKKSYMTKTREKKWKIYCFLKKLKKHGYRIIRIWSDEISIENLFRKII